MIRLFLISLLIFSLLCMVPLMGSQHGVSHVHHGASASCSTCMGAWASSEWISLLSLLGFVTLIISTTLPLAPLPVLFHPPR